MIKIIHQKITSIKLERKYKAGAYYQITKTPYTLVERDTGKYGEYLTYQCLKKFEAIGGKFLFNLYLPKGEGQTTEVDILLIGPKGLFVLESKNYSGWIFGEEKQKYWRQIFPRGKGRSHTEYFYNPMRQNQTHIKSLKALLDPVIPIYSIIVFSDRCELKSVPMDSDEEFIVQRGELASLITALWDQSDSRAFHEDEINHLYVQLYPYTQVSAEVKEKHLTDVQHRG
ncbi:MAG: NERD domain-containing protein [Clostridiales bacterium]|nr:NERD domain-containing protein [Clostridiales bacterium]